MKWIPTLGSELTVRCKIINTEIIQWHNRRDMKNNIHLDWLDHAQLPANGRIQNGIEPYYVSAGTRETHVKSGH